MQNGTLEWYFKNWKEHCEACQKQLLVHGLRNKTPAKRKIVYASCNNKDCRKFNQEIAFIGG